jgi:hypothetical protein
MVPNSQLAGRSGLASSPIAWHIDANLGNQITELRKRFSTKQRIYNVFML